MKVGGQREHVSLPVSSFGESSLALPHKHPQQLRLHNISGHQRVSARRYKSFILFDTAGQKAPSKSPSEDRDVQRAGTGLRSDFVALRVCLHSTRAESFLSCSLFFVWV